MEEPNLRSGSLQQAALQRWTPLSRSFLSQYLVLFLLEGRCLTLNHSLSTSAKEFTNGTLCIRSRGQTYTSLPINRNKVRRLDYHEKRRAFVSKLGPQPRAQNKLNIGFTHYLLGREEEFKENIAAAVELLEPRSNKWMISSK